MDKANVWSTEVYTEDCCQANCVATQKQNDSEIDFDDLSNIPHAQALDNEV